MNFKAVKSLWRPTFAWVFIAIFAGFGIIIIALLALGSETLDSASSIMVAMIGAGGVVTGAYVGGRSYEKGLGQEMSEYEVPVPPQGYQPGIDQNTGFDDNGEVR